ncbi:hypothetical protein KJ865_10120 [Myxococcota bacterium]|nr:hypothetical protein [Myxococcota bacterium]
MKHLTCAVMLLTFFLGCTEEKPRTAPADKPVVKKPDPQHRHTVVRFYLQQNEVPKGFVLLRDQSGETPSVKKGPYVEFGGTHTGYRMWKGPGIIVDSRWIFPTPAAAKGFFTKAEAINAEGLTRAKDPGFGDESRLYTGVIKHPTITNLQLRSALCYFRKGSMVGKVFLAWEQRDKESVDKTPVLLETVRKHLTR